MKIKDSIKNIKIKTIKYSPELLMATGIIGTVCGTFLACRATLKVDEVIKQSNEDIKKIHDVANNVELYGDEYSKKDAKKDLFTVYVQTGVKVAALYAPSVLVTTISIACMIGSNKILKKRNIALGMAFTTINSGFKKYRERVVEKYGSDEDKNLLFGLKNKKIEKIVTDQETGETKKIKTNVNIVDDKNLKSGFACYFDEESKSYEKESDYNMMFLNATQNYANDKLRIRGFLFLNEVKEMLDLPLTKEGQVVGWIYNGDDDKSDGYVDFRISEVYRETEDGDVEPAILLDFNVDGNILDKI